MLTMQELVSFEEEIKELYLAGKIHSPVHLSKNNEQQLIEIFKEIKPDDWVFSTWRSHYHALLKGIPADWLRQEILANRSISINNAEYKFFSSAIAGGILPIALGVAMALKRKGCSTHVWCFVGDMTSQMGVFHEVTKYAGGHALPITFLVEDNGLSVNTPTKEVWGKEGLPDIRRYEYERGYPHHGLKGVWINF